MLGSHMMAGDPAVSERLGTSAAVLEAQGMTAVGADQASRILLDRVVASQSTVIAFDTAFLTIALLFVVAVPILAVAKMLLTAISTKSS